MITRRDLFKLLGLAGASHLLAPLSFGSATFLSETILSGYRADEENLLKDAGLHLGGGNLDLRIKLDNEIHSIIYSKKLDLKVFLPKLDRFGYYQRGNGPLVRFFPEKGNYFYGHGVIDEERGVLYTTQALATKDRDDKSRLGHESYIFVNSLNDFSQVGSFSGFGKDPHDFLSSDDKLFICNGGHDSCISVVDLKTRKLIRKYQMKDSPLSLRHITKIDESNFAIATLGYTHQERCHLIHLNLENGLTKFQTPDEVADNYMIGQLLSIICHGGYVYATCPMMNSLVVWDTNGGFVGGHVIPRAASLGFLPSEQGVVVGSGVDDEPARLARVVDNKLTVRKLNWAKSISGSHSLIL